MSAGAAHAQSALYVVGLIMALVIMAVSAAFVGIQWSGASDGNFSRADPAPPIVMTTWAVLSSIYFITFFIVRHVNSANFSVCIIMDVVFLSILIVVGVGGTATMSVLERRGGWVKAAEGGYTGGIPTVGIVSLSLGWAQVALLLAILAFEVIYTLRHYGPSADVWQLSFLDLTDPYRIRDRRRVDLTMEEASALHPAPITVAPTSEIRPFPLATDDLPPYDGPGLSPLTSTSSPLSPITPASTRPLPSRPVVRLPSSSPLSPMGPMPDWKRDTLACHLPEWKREALAGPHLPIASPVQSSTYSRKL